ncbi:unnamed protein product [Cochlearia groenlandica]
MSKSNILIVSAILLINLFVFTSMARPDPTLHSKSTEIKKKCSTEECLMKTMLDAHIDYIYTQPSPTKPIATNP